MTLRDDRHRFTHVIPSGAQAQRGGSVLMLPSADSVFRAPDRRLRAGWRFCAGVLVFLVADSIIGPAAGSLVPGARPLAVQAAMQVATLITLLGGFVFLLIALDGVDERPLAAMGLAWRRISRWQIVAGIATSFAMVLLCVAGIAASSSVNVHTSAAAHSLLRAALALFVIAVAAMCEESAFRGYPFQRLVEAAGPVPAVVMASAFFGLVHIGNPNVSRWAVANTVLFGVLLSIAYLRSRSLWLPWGIHFGWNALIAVGFGLPLSGLTMFGTVVRIRPSGPHWITGGPYGIEAGALATVIILAAIPAVWWLGGKLPARSPVAAAPVET